MLARALGVQQSSLLRKPSPGQLTGELRSLHDIFGNSRLRLHVAGLALRRSTTSYSWKRPLKCDVRDSFYNLIARLAACCQRCTPVSMRTAALSQVPDFRRPPVRHWCAGTLFELIGEPLEPFLPQPAIFNSGTSKDTCARHRHGLSSAKARRLQRMGVTRSCRTATAAGPSTEFAEDPLGSCSRHHQLDVSAIGDPPELIGNVENRVVHCVNRSVSAHEHAKRLLRQLNQELRFLDACLVAQKLLLGAQRVQAAAKAALQALVGEIEMRFGVVARRACSDRARGAAR